MRAHCQFMADQGANFFFHLRHVALIFFHEQSVLDVASHISAHSFVDGILDEFAFVGIHDRLLQLKVSGLDLGPAPAVYQGTVSLPLTAASRLGFANSRGVALFNSPEDSLPTEPQWTKMLPFENSDQKRVGNQAALFRLDLMYV